MFDTMVMTGQELNEAMAAIIITPFGEDGRTVVVTCLRCIADANGIDPMAERVDLPIDALNERNTALCDCGMFACTHGWVLNHIANVHVGPNQASAKMEES